MKPGRRWTGDDDARLIAQWGVVGATALRHSFAGRSDSAIYARARVLGLSVDVQAQGRWTIKEAASECGMTPELLARILRAYEVPCAVLYRHGMGSAALRLALVGMGATAHPLGRWRTVDVDAAVQWRKDRDSVYGHARRLGVSRELLRRWCRDAGFANTSARMCLLTREEADAVVSWRVKFSQHRRRAAYPASPRTTVAPTRRRTACSA